LLIELFKIFYFIFESTLGSTVFEPSLYMYIASVLKLNSKE